MESFYPLLVSHPVPTRVVREVFTTSVYYLIRRLRSLSEDRGGGTVR